MEADGIAARVEAVETGSTGFERGAPGGFMVVMEKDPALPVDGAVGPMEKVVGSMVGVSGANTLNEDLTDVRDVVSIGVL